MLVLNIIVMLTALAAGWLLAWLCKDELVPDRKWLLTVFYCLVAAFAIFFFLYSSQIILLGLAYMIVVVAVMMYLGYNKKFVAGK